MSENLKVGTLVGVVAIVAVVGGLLVGASVGGALSGQNAGGTRNYDNPVFTYGARAGLTETQIIDANARWVGRVSSSQAFALTGSFTSAGDNRLASFVRTDANGALPNIVISTTSPNMAILTAAQECDNPVIDVANGVSATGTILLASTTAMTADCLTTVGDTLEFRLWNASTTGFLGLSVGGSSTLVTSINATSSLDAREITDVSVTLVTSSSQPWLIYSQRHAQ